MNVLMIGVDETSVGGMLTVVNNYRNNREFCKKVNLQYIATVIRAGKFKKLFTFLSKIPRIISMIKKEKIDIVHVHMAERGSVFREGFVVWLAKKKGCKTIIHMHGATIEDWYRRQNKVVKRIVKKIFCLPDKMLVLGENWRPFIENVVGEKFKNKVTVLYNAVDVADTNQYNVNASNVLFYGMLIQRKGIDDLLLAFKGILDKIPKHIMLILYGDDYDSEEKINDKIKRFGLIERAHYNGWLTNENRESVFKNTIVNVLPSYNEGLPMTILESMGYGIPNISTNIAAIPEAIDNGINGFLITPGDTESLSNRLLEIINNESLRREMSNAAYQKAKDNFSLFNHFRQLISIYNDILN